MFKYIYFNLNWHPWHPGFSVDANSFEETPEALHFNKMTMKLLGANNSKLDNIKEMINLLLPSTMKTKSVEATGDNSILTNTSNYFLLPQMNHLVVGSKKNFKTQHSKH